MPMVEDKTWQECETELRRIIAELRIELAAARQERDEIHGLYCRLLSKTYPDGAA
jgi:hypothetical protein